MTTPEAIKAHYNSSPLIQKYWSTSEKYQEYKKFLEFKKFLDILIPYLIQWNSLFNSTNELDEIEERHPTTKQGVWESIVEKSKDKDSVLKLKAVYDDYLEKKIITKKELCFPRR